MLRQPVTCGNTQRATTRLARRPAWPTLLGGALLATAATSRLPTVHSSPAPAPGGGGRPPHPTRPTTPAPAILPPLAGTETCPDLTDLQEDTRQRTHAALWEGIGELGLSVDDSVKQALALLEESADEIGLNGQEVHAVGHAVTTDLHDTHLCDEPDNTANCEWLRQKAYVRAHAVVTKSQASRHVKPETEGSSGFTIPGPATMAGAGATLT